MDRRRIFLPLALAALVLAACAAPQEPDPLPEAPEETVVALPETERLEPFSAPAIVTEGRAPAEDYDLPTSMGEREDSWRNMIRWVHEGAAVLLAEAPGACFYALPRTEEDAHETALIRWGDSAAEFDWDFVTPRAFPPEMYCFDFDRDEEDELVVLCYSGSGTGVSVYDLHVVEKNEDGTLTDYSTFRYAEDGSPLWDEIPSLLRLERLDGRAFLILGRELAEVDPDLLPEEDRQPFTGSIIQFEVFPEKGRVQFWGGVDVFPASYVADISADVAYRDGVFTLSNFHLYENWVE